MIYPLGKEANKLINTEEENLSIILPLVENSTF